MKDVYQELYLCAFNFLSDLQDEIQRMQRDLEEMYLLLQQLQDSPPETGESKEDLQLRLNML